jgi:hypothetical protein
MPSDLSVVGLSYKQNMFSQSLKSLSCLVPKAWAKARAQPEPLQCY